ncbi:MAG TPA: amino acid adenylation domain-containing protein [Polyangiaceae bacterium]|nr:amino acid adenylation domain-containing protein [Polyangiaceae bacterium]
MTGRAGERAPEPEALRAALARSLPAAMLPWPIRVLDAMPLSPNGKLDRRALPAPDAPAADRPYVPPRTEAERVLASIWAEVLRHERVGVEDDFFELGGDSIMTLQIIARAARHGLRLTPKLLFEHPTIAAAAERAEAAAPEPAEAPPPAADPGAELSPEEWRDLLEEIGRLPVSTNNGPDPASNVESVYPLSPMQEGMLFYTLLRPRSGIYLMQNRYRLEGDLRPDAFVRGWQLVAARHPVFRTSFAWKSQKRPLQVVHKRVELPFDVLDWRDLDEAAQEARLDLLLRRELEEGFDFGKAPLTRFRLVRLGERTYEFVHSFHHILFDEWCTSLIMMDFLSYYESLLRGEPPSLPPARPYRDYIDWLGRQDLPAAEAHWRAELRGFTNPTPLGFDGARPPDAAGGEQVEDLVSRLSPGATAALAALAQRHRLTLNTLVQGAWALLLRRYSGEREVLFGVTVAGRPPELPGVESIVGLFINTLPLRVRVPDGEPLLPWLKALQDRNLLLRQHGHAPLASVQGWSEVERGRPLFQSLLVFENAPIDPALREGRIAFRVQQVRDRVHTNYPITIMSWADAALPLKISYDRAAVPPDAAARLLGHLGTLLEGMADRPDARLGELPMLTPDERRQALVEWNHAPPAEPDFSSYAALFDAQAARAPDAVAAACRDRRLTYAELGRDAGRLASALAARGVGPERRVALLDERGLELLTMIVAVFKAGGAYVPLSTDDPSERAARALVSSEACLLLTREALRERAEAILRAVAPARPPALATFEGLMGEGHAEGPPPDRGGPGHLAYVIYTSGSTGVPKGAMVERRGMLNNMLSKVPRLSLRPGDVIAQTASPCFDISVWQFLTAPLFGGEVEIVPDEIARDPGRLLDHVERRGVAVLEVVPAVLKGMLEAAGERAEPPALARLRWVLPTGEALPSALAREWLTRYPHVPLMNAYGPAECSDDVALHPLTEPPDEGASQVPIGRPVDHLRLYVLDPLLEPAPVGVCGELYVGGIGVGRGYAGDARRTAAAFVPDPFSREPGRRLYRTGDLGRYLTDGAIEFAGRRDHQVKLRGYRIELGEIEARLGEHESVREAAVLVREDRPGSRRLVAYVAASEPAPTAEGLRAWLEARLPEYMVPRAFVFLPALPRTPNGKPDRRALPAPESGGAPDFVPPRTATEGSLAGIWADVLGLPRVSREDSFFDLGGHSLLLTQIAARVRRAFGVEVPLRALFEAPTVAGQARAIEAARGAGPAPLAPPPIAARPRDGAPLPLSFAQERLWFLAQLEPTAASYNVPAAVRLRGALDAGRLARAFEALAERHEALRARFVDSDGSPAVVTGAGRLVDFALTDLSALAAGEREDEARRSLERRASQPFDLAIGPLARASLVRLDEREHVLLVVLHHIVSDGWSMNVLVREIAELYAADAEGREPALAPLPVQYADYARWQREWLQGPALERQLAYWRQRLGGELPALSLPTDRPRPAARSYRGARHAFALPPALAADLLGLARGQGVTPFVLLLAGFKALLGHYAGQTDLCVGTPIANRTLVELEPLIGFFANTLVIRTDLGQDPPFTELVVRVREGVLEAQAHQDLPFERLVQALRPARNLGQTPLFQAMFSLAEAQPRAGAGTGLEMLPFEVDAGSSQFDLSLHMALEPGGLSASFEYSTDLFESRTVDRMAGEFCALLEGVVARPTARLSELPLPARPTPAARVPAGAAPESPPPAPKAPDAEPRTAEEALLAQVWAGVLGRTRVGAHDNFFELGGDSILSLQVVARARAAGLAITARQMFQYQTLAELAAAARAAPAPGASPDEGPVQGPAPLTPIQRQFFARELANPHHWNQALLLATTEPLARSALEAAVRALVLHHDALRLRYTRDGAGAWRQAHADGEAADVVHWVDLSGVPEAGRREALEAHAARWQASLDLGSGPLVRAVAFDLGPGRPGRLLLVAHHLVIDGVSWRILLEDLQAAHDQAQRGEPIRLPGKTTSFKRWAERLRAAADDATLQREAAFWLDLPWGQVRPLPVDEPSAEPTEASSSTVSVALDEADTRDLLAAASEAGRTRIEELLLAALATALARWAGGGAVAVEVEGHGREELEGEEFDLSRTVGWFTSAYPVVLEVEPGAGPGAALGAVKERLRRLPRRGLPYGVVRELGAGPVAEQLRRLPGAAISFNYLGQWDGALGAGARFSPAAESPGAERDPHNALPYELAVDAAVYGGRFEATWAYSGARYRRETVEAVCALFRDALRGLIAHCLSPEASAYAPSDFPDVELLPQELDAILAQMS